VGRILVSEGSDAVEIRGLPQKGWRRRRISLSYFVTGGILAEIFETGVDRAEVASV
jgi:hypothetical protein